MWRPAEVRASSAHTRGGETHPADSSECCNGRRIQKRWLEVGRGHVGIERIDRALQVPVAEADDVLIDPAGRQRQDPALGCGEEIRYEVADLHDREVMTRGVETKREKVVNVVIRLATRREDRPNSARRDDRNVAADWIIADDTSDRSTERDGPVERTERTPDGEL